MCGAKAPLAAPKAITGLTYDGTTKTGVAEGEGYTLENNTATDAGTYTATATLKDGYVWADEDFDGKIEWSIAKADAKVTANNAEKNYGDTDPEFTAIVTGTYGDDKLTYTFDRAEGTGIGTYTITVTGDAVQGNYNVTYETGSLKINPIGKVTVPTAKTGLVYNGDTQTGVEAGTGYTIEGNTGKDAGTYTATAKIADGYIWADGSTEDVMISWSIDRAMNNIFGEVEQSGWICGETPVEADLTYVEAAFGTPVAVYYTEESCENKIDPASISVAGTYYVRAEVAGTDNYEGCATDAVSFTADAAMAGPTTLKLTSIRTTGTPGLRFAAYVTDEQREASASYGFLVARETADLKANPKHLVFNSSNSTSGKNEYDVSYTSGAAYDKANDIDKIYSEDGKPFGMPDVEATFFTGVMINIPKAFYAENLIARSYMVVDGVTLYGETYSKSLYTNACAIRDGGYAGLNDDEIKYIDSIIGAVENEVDINIDDLYK